MDLDTCMGPSPSLIGVVNANKGPTAGESGLRSSFSQLVELVISFRYDGRSKKNIERIVWANWSEGYDI